MLRRYLIVLVAVSIGIVATGCQQAEVRDLTTQRDNLAERLEEAEARKASLENSLEMARAQNRDLREQLSGLETSKGELSEALARYQEQEKRQQEEYAELQRLVENLAGITAETGPEGNIIRLEDRVLFALGRAELDDDAKRALDQIAEFLKEQPKRELRIAGHTDGVPIVHSAWTDNHELSAARANSVRRYLASEGLDEENMYIVGYGPNRPYVTPDEPQADMPENRRVEILLVPEGRRQVSDILRDFDR